MTAKPVCTRPARSTYNLSGFATNYLANVTEQWLKPAPAANSAMLEIFRDRDRYPLRDMVPWSGEFAGKYLTSSVQILRLTKDKVLREQLKNFVAEFVSLQATDGYLGPWPSNCRLTGKAPNSSLRGWTWDTWGHYHAMLGLIFWYEESADRKALECAIRIANLICRKFLGKKKRGQRLVDTGSSEMNLAVIHSLCLLYRKIQDRKYLTMALQIVDEFGRKGPDGQAGDYLRTGLSGEEFYATPKPRWESLHPIMGLVELYWLTGQKDFRTAFEHLWWSIVKTDRHNNGGFTSGEKAQGNPYHQGAIETCCTVAWVSMSIEMLKLTANSVVADEIELSTVNSGVGLHSNSGRWVTYNTPMDGVRNASAHDIVFQARAGSPELNCCSVNGPRILGMISDWAIMKERAGLVLNWYGPGSMVTRVGGTSVELIQDTEYPRKNSTLIKVNPAQAVVFALKCRIPYWSKNTVLRVNGEKMATNAGSYATIKRRWQRGDVIELSFDFSLHFWHGEKECRGKVSIYRGPILLTYDRRLNRYDPDQIPEIDAQKARAKLVAANGDDPIVAVDISGVGGRTVRLCDFGSAGEGGSPYLSWLRVRNTGKVPFSKVNPLRSGRPR